MTRFDRTAPGEGMLIYSRIENGKAYLEFQLFLKENDRKAESMMAGASCFADICLYDMSGSLVLEIEYPLQEEEPAEGLLLYPHLWRGTADPYLYRVKVQLLEKHQTNWQDLEKASEQKPDGCLAEKEPLLDVLERYLPLRHFEEISHKGYFLNGQDFTLRSVTYSLPPQPCRSISQKEYLKIQKELQLLKEMGVNTICLDLPVYDDKFVQLCDRMGLLVWCGNIGGQSVRSSDLLSPEGIPTDLYYYKKACWSREPFLYIAKRSLKRQKNGSYSLTVYSNQKKVALYVEGVLFEFQVSAPEFRFEEIPEGKHRLLLTAEAGECRVSMTVYD